MKIVLVSTSDRKGGAAIACSRIFQALKKNGTDVKMLVRDKISSDKDVYTLNTNIFYKILNFMSFSLERLQILFNLKFRRKYLFHISLDNFGAVNLLDNPLIKEADVINFHWTSQGLLSLKQLEKLLLNNKKIVFTMHDMHYFTGICHYARKCENYKTGCGNCQFLNFGKEENDLSKRYFKKKLELPDRHKVFFIACSNWLKDIAKSSLIFSNSQVFSIPNPIDTEVFKPSDKALARKKFGIEKKYVILFGAAKITDKRKGFNFLAQALKTIHEKNPNIAKDIELLIFGSGTSQAVKDLPFSCKSAGYIGSEKDISLVYNASDVYVIPSLEDNLPNTVMEALSCAVPCVAFNTGGLPQLIDNGQNGYLAPLRDSNALAECILNVILNKNYTELCHNARNKVEANFSQTVIVMKYNEIYRQVSI